MFCFLKNGLQISKHTYILNCNKKSNRNSEFNNFLFVSSEFSKLILKYYISTSSKKAEEKLN